ncbi:cation transporter [Staphylococcus condimenti]|uniref:Cation transporter n=1 Tax=Staphylococcus condimenti TaxID=70255 RepID=A0A143PE95_9STAP|nr:MULTISPECIES: cation diffusion facilitator family transporter [Staphylococcus]AMY06593.1 cation transporter [Staphylococcus condimenti]APR60474.1 cation-efflux pump [Staphylococcus condimenti]MDK8645892.1 cation diffusion facilitator family transporter [Staphylococcus condimenti]OFP03438.1 cation transporter [Staphylococcus sp. HMSC065E08]PNZ59497.1 cation transporter [Staphylococcus condimenti]
MSHSEHEHHHHHHVHTDNKRVLAFSFAIITIFMIVELIGGYFANSLALLSDGVHMLSDAFSLGLALFAFKYGERHATTEMTFGYKRFEILAALFNGVLLFVISIGILIEAIRRIAEPPEVMSTEMLMISIIGLIVNVIVAWLMMRGGDTHHNINMRGAFLHVLGDLLGSVGAIAAAILIWLFNFTLADPIASMLVSVLLLRSSYGLIKDSLTILMEGTPKDINIDEVVNSVLKEKEIENVHDCHVWTISNDLNAFSCHAVVQDSMTIEECEQLLHRIEIRLNDLNINHMTIQLESKNNDHSSKTLCEHLSIAH